MRSPEEIGALIATVRKYEKTPFRWGRNDCCLFAARCIDAMKGSDYATSLSLHYKNRRQAYAFISSHGSISGAVSSFLGSMRPGLPRLGDVALLETVHGDGVGVCIGPSIAVTGDDGLVYYRRDSAKGYWEV